MKSSRVFLLLGLVAAIVLLVSSEVAARDLAAETSTGKVIYTAKIGRIIWPSSLHVFLFLPFHKRLNL